jgi:hypothetical protein
MAQVNSWPKRQPLVGHIMLWDGHPVSLRFGHTFIRALKDEPDAS